MKQKIIALLTLAAMLLGGCGTAKPENPYRLVKSELNYNHDPFEGDSSYTSTYSYTEEGWLAQVDSYLDGNWESTQVFSHDAYGNVYGTTTTSADGTSSYGESKLTLDDQHRPILEASYNPDGTLFSTQETTYDAHGNILQRVTTRVGALDGKDWTDTVQWQYDAKGNPIRQDICWNDGSASYILYDYQDGRLVKETSYDVNRPDRATEYKEYTYDETGLVQTRQDYDKNGQLVLRCVTTFDEYGNELTIDTYRNTEDGTLPDTPTRTIVHTYALSPQE